MDDGLVRHGHKSQSRAVYVLILVVMDDGLVQGENPCIWKHYVLS